MKYKTADYYSIFKKIAGQLSSGKIKDKEMGKLIKKELGIPERPKNRDIEKIREYNEYQDFYHSIIRNNKELYNAFRDLFYNYIFIPITGPFSIKGCAFKVVKLFKILCLNKNNPEYYITFLFVLLLYSENQAQLPVTAEGIKVFDTKYLHDSYDCP